MEWTPLGHELQQLEQQGELRRVYQAVDPHLQLAAIQRRLYENRGPALLFHQVKGSRFPVLANLYGTMERCQFLFRHSWEAVRSAVRLRADPSLAFKEPMLLFRAAKAAIHALPKRVPFRPEQWQEVKISDLPGIVSWPQDGGPFITLPQVLTQEPLKPGVMQTNLGMYRVQLSGNQYHTDEEIGLHYQIHRGIGVHHAAALSLGRKLPVSIFVGGHSAHAFAAVMPLPEGLSELVFAGMLAGRRFRYARLGQHLVSADADFCILGYLDAERLKPEGPFGDHLGYYSLRHDFPVLQVERVLAKPKAIWPFTVVGRPPQEDTSFGAMVHGLTAPMVPATLPGVKALHAVDAAGVHPLLLAIGSERYTPYELDRRPQELLTIANAILGFGQCSLSKYLFLAAHEDDPALDIHQVDRFFQHVLERVDLTRDLHFHTASTMDTLDYTGGALNCGSKLVIAAAGKPRRQLLAASPGKNLGLELPGFGPVLAVMPGVGVVQGPSCLGREAFAAAQDLERLKHAIAAQGAWPAGLPLLVLADDAAFVAASVENFLWVSFTRSDPARDIYGLHESVRHKHWLCEAPMIIDARRKPHHAPPLEEDEQVEAGVDAWASKLPGDLAKYLVRKQGPREQFR